MNPAEYYKRIDTLLDTSQLHNKTVAVIGLGSGGGRVALELGRLGISLLLVERAGEQLEEHNLVRHILGYESLGRSKLSEMKKHIHRRNPATRITCFAIDVAQQRRAFERMVGRRRPDLIAVCTDTETSKHAVNAVAVRHRIPQVGAGVYDGGIGGEVYRVLPDEACYGCIAAQLQPHENIPQGSAPDYNGGGNPGIVSTCALNLDIEQIALLQIRMILEVLELTAQSAGVPAPANVWVFANRLVPGTFPRPFHAEFFSLKRNNRCLECGSQPEDMETQAAGILERLGRGGRRRSHRGRPAHFDSPELRPA